MNLQTYVYGTPHGFDMFEETSSLKEFFKSFYISSRKGSRLVISRKDSGETLYNYLHYGLMEKEGRPNSFFGMTLVVDDGAYVQDFTGMYDWFEFLFITFLNRQNTLFSDNGNSVLFRTKEDGIIQYCVDKFQNANDEVEWIKSQIPNILSSSAGTKIDHYNSSFVWKRNGQIALHNNEDYNVEILSDFKKYSTVAISKSFTKTISLDYREMVSFLNDFNQQLLPIAVNKDENSFNDLENINSTFSALYSLLSSYIQVQKGKDDIEYQDFNKLKDKYDSLKQQISKLLSSYKVDSKKSDSNHDAIGIGDSSRLVNIKYCVGCKQNKKISEFSSREDNICAECKRKNQYRLKKCQKCGKSLRPIDFNGTNLICKECERRHADEQNKFWKENAYWIKIALLCAVFTFIIVFLVFAFRGCSNSQEIVDSDSIQGVNLKDSSAAISYVDEDEFNRLIRSNNYSGVIKYLKRCKDGDFFIDKVNSSVQSCLWQIIQSSIFSNDEYLRKWFLENPDVVGELKLNADEWLSKYNNFKQAHSLIEKPNLSEQDFTRIQTLISDFPNEIKGQIIALLDEKRRMISNNIPKKGKESNIDSTTSSNVSVFKNTEMLANGINKNRGYEGQPGDIFTINSDQEIVVSNTQKDIQNFSITRNSDRKVTIKILSSGQLIINAGTIQITLTCPQKQTHIEL